MPFLKRLNLLLSNGFYFKDLLIDEEKILQEYL